MLASPSSKANEANRGRGQSLQDFKLSQNRHCEFHTALRQTHLFVKLGFAASKANYFHLGKNVNGRQFPFSSRRGHGILDRAIELAV